MSTLDDAAMMAVPSVPGYRLGRRVGHDALGTWFDAEQLNLRRRVTVKLLHPQLKGSAPARRAFETEMNRLAPLEHPNLLCMLDARREGRLALVLDGTGIRTVADEIRERRWLDDATAMACARDMARAVSYLGRMQLGCVGLGPELVHVFGEGKCRLMTLGNVVPASELAGPRARLGGGNLAPEQIEGFVSARTPSYHLGVFLAEMLTGRRPGEATMIEIADGERLERVGSRTLELVRACAQRDPGRRPPPGAVADMLDRLLRRPATPVPRAVPRRA